MKKSVRLKPNAFLVIFNYIVTKANLATKMRAMIVATISFFVYLPVKSVIRI